jgi:hypothetical protein
MPEIPIPGVPTIAEDLDELLRSINRLLSADGACQYAALTPSEYDEAGIARAKADRLRAMHGLTDVACVTAERQRWRRELADQQH